ncbi:hypothetical protein NTH35_004177 [Vibrio fluvialis]|nr:hypothetical protein [Vibrio fluvialis]
MKNGCILLLLLFCSYSNASNFLPCASDMSLKTLHKEAEEYAKNLDFPNQYNCLRNAASQNDASAMYKLGELYQNKNLNLASYIKRKEAIYWYSAANMYSESVKTNPMSSKVTPSSKIHTASEQKLQQLDYKSFLTCNYKMPENELNNVTRQFLEVNRTSPNDINNEQLFNCFRLIAAHNYSQTQYDIGNLISHGVPHNGLNREYEDQYWYNWAAFNGSSAAKSYLQNQQDNLSRILNNLKNKNVQ